MTYEWLASATDLTKGGIVYHFPTRSALLAAMVESETNVLREAVMQLANDQGVSPVEAYIRWTLTPSEIKAHDPVLAAEMGQIPDAVAPWTKFLFEIEELSIGPGVDGIDVRIARMAAERFARSIAIGNETVPEADRAKVLDRLLQMVRVR